MTQADPSLAAAAASWRDQAPYWWRVARPFSLTAAAIPVLVGGALANIERQFDPLNFGLYLAPSLLIQVATNAFNEYYDYQRGLDTDESVGIAGVIVGGQLSARAVLWFAIGCLAVALPFCLALVARTGPIVLTLGVLSALAAWLYSGGPKPIAYTPFGEITVFIFMGLIQVAIGYIIHTQAYDLPALWAAFPVACLVAAILLANNLRDEFGDAQRGRRTLPIVLGRRHGIAILAGLLYGAFLATTFGVLMDRLPPWALVVWITLPRARASLELFALTTDPRRLDAAVKRTAQFHLQFGLALTVGLLLARLMQVIFP